MQLINWFIGKASKELLNLTKEKGWNFDDLLWAINIAVCSKSIEDKEDVQELTELLIELNPYLNVYNDSLSKAYSQEAIGFLSKSTQVNEGNLEAYKSRLKDLLKLRVDFAKEYKPQIAQHILGN